jgi:hypothetical protein
LIVSLDRLPPPVHAQVPPADFLLTALQSHPVVFFGDIHPLAEPKEIVAEVVARQDPEAPLSLLALEVGSDQQPWIDAYLASSPEDTTILLEHSRTLRAHWGASREYLGIYRAAWRWNAAHPAAPLRILAADIRGWPMAPLTDGMAVGGFVNRDAWMAEAFVRTLRREPAARILIFMGGYHGLKTIGGEVTIGQVHERFDRWFAGYLGDAGTPVYTVFTDAVLDEGHGASRIYDQLAPGFPGANVAVPLDTLSDLIRMPLHEVKQERYHLEFLPLRFAMRNAVDAMVLLNAARPISIFDGVYDLER